MFCIPQNHPKLAVQSVEGRCHLSKKKETTLTACNKVSALTNQHNFDKLILPMTSVCVMHIKSLGYISNEKWALLSDRPCYNSHS